MAVFLPRRFSWETGAAFSVLLLAGAIPALAQTPDPAQLQQMCGNPQLAGMPQIADLCKNLPSMMQGKQDDLTKGPAQNNTMTGSGPGFATPPGMAAGNSKVPTLPGEVGDGAAPGMPGAPGAMEAPGQGQQGAAGGASGSSGGIGESHIPSLRNAGMRQMSNAAQIRERMMRNAPKAPPKPPDKSKAEIAAEEAKKKAEEEKKRKEDEAKKEAAKRAEEEKAKAQARKKEEPAPAPPLSLPPKPPPLYENQIQSEFTLEISLLKDVDTGRPYLGPRRLSDIVIGPPRPALDVKDGIVWEIPPDFRFGLCPLDHDPFNLGLPKKISLKKGFLDAILDRLARLKKGKKRAVPAASLHYLSFESSADDPSIALLGAGGIVPVSMYWAGPDGASLGPAAAPSGESAAPTLTGVEPPEGYDDAQWARLWGIEY